MAQRFINVPTHFLSGEDYCPLTLALFPCGALAGGKRAEPIPNLWARSGVFQQGKTLWQILFSGIEAAMFSLGGNNL